MNKHINKIKILIETDGVTTLSRLIFNGEILKEASSKCHKEDTFSFQKGVYLSLKRLFDREGKRKVLEIKDKTGQEYKLEVGKDTGKFDSYGTPLKVGDLLMIKAEPKKIKGFDIFREGYKTEEVHYILETGDTHIPSKLDDMKILNIYRSKKGKNLNSNDFCLLPWEVALDEI